MCGLEARFLKKIPVLTREALISLRNSLTLRLYFLCSPPVINFWPSKVSSWGENLAEIIIWTFLFCVLPFLDPASFLHQMTSLSVFPLRSAGVPLWVEDGGDTGPSSVQRLRGWKYCQHAEAAFGTRKLTSSWLLLWFLTSPCRIVS